MSIYYSDRFGGVGSGLPHTRSHNTSRSLFLTGVAPPDLTFFQLIILFTSEIDHLYTSFDASKVSRLLICCFLSLYYCMLFLYITSCLTHAAYFISRCTSRIVWTSLEEPLRKIAPPVTYLEFLMRYLKVLQCSRLLVILSWENIIFECATMDYSIDPDVPVPKFK